MGGWRVTEFKEEFSMDHFKELMGGLAIITIACIPLYFGSVNVINSGAWWASFLYLAPSTYVLIFGIAVVWDVLFYRTKIVISTA